MPSISLFIITTTTAFIVLICAPHLLSCTSIASRRILHQPFLPLNTFPPSQPPSPSPPSPQTTTTTTTTTTPTTPTPTPKIPFSTSTPNPSPFFPSYPSTPPPPSPASFASFPANISSLILPNSSQPKRNSQKLLIVAISAVISAVIVAAILICFYYRRYKQNRNLTEEKSHSYRSDNSHRVYQTNAETTRSSSHKLRTGSTASSEFLYLGTLVNSRRGIDGNADSQNDDDDDDGGVLDTLKMESPELQPLPPLARHNVANVDEETEDEFYSPRMSLGGRESSSGTGSGSRRVFSAIAGESGFGARSESSCCSCSSSSSGSPARSNSVSISPPVSLSPRRSEPKSPELTQVHVPPPPPPQQQQQQQSLASSHSSLSPERGLDRTADVSPGISDVWYRNVRSPPLSLASTSPDRTLIKEADASHVLNWNVRSPTLSSPSISPHRESPRVSNALDSNVQSPSLSPASLLSRRGGSEKSASASPRISNVSDHNRRRSPSVSERGLKDESPRISDVSNHNRRGLKDESPRISDVSNHNRPSPSVLSSSSSSPERGGLKDESPRKSDVSNHNRQSPSVLSSSSSSPERGGLKDASPRISDASNHNRRSASVLSSSSSSPDTGLKDASPRISYASNHNRLSASVLSSSSSSPDTGLKDASSPRISDASNHNRRSPSVLSSSSSSPERGLKDASPRISDVSDQKVQSPVTISSSLEQPTSAPPPPPPPLPPPPPPPLPPQRHWENPSPSTPIGQLISRPPPLIPPSRPFVIQNATEVSPIESLPSSKAVENAEETPKLKLKPLHWDKVRASSDREMVWDHLRSSSFKLNEEMIETLFVVHNPTPQQKQTTPRSVLPSPNQENRVLDPKKSQNIAIALRALNVTIEEICEALLEGNADTLGTELLESLLKMAPTKEEERKLKEYKDDSPTKLGPAEKFLKAMLDVPFAFKRVDAMLYVTNFESEIEYLKRSFETLEAACEELRSSRMFLKLLEAVLKTGNRMNVGTNRGDAHAFKLDTLLKLVDVKGADGKTTLLHFVVQEIIRTEGARISCTNQNPNSTLNEDAKCRKLGLQVVSGLSLELTNVKKSAAMDSDVLSSDVSKLSRGIENINEVVRLNETIGSDGSSQKFSESMNRFMRMAEEEIYRIQAQESVTLSLVKEITEYFHGNSAKEEAHPFRIFMVVRDFLTILDRVCKEVGMINERTIVSSAHKFPVPVNPMMPQVFPVPVNPMMPQVFPGFQGRRQCSSDDDES